MKFEFKNFTKTIEIGDDTFIVYLDDQTFQEAHDAMIARYAEMARGENIPSVSEHLKELKEYLHIAFGDEQFKKLRTHGNLSLVNCQRLYLALVKLVNEYSEETDVRNLLAEFDL